MPARVKTSTTRLPQALREQIESSEANSHSHPSWKKSKGKLSRKEARKQERDSKKVHKATYFSQSSNTNKRPAAVEAGEPPKKKAKVSHDSSGTSGTSHEKTGQVKPTPSLELPSAKTASSKRAKKSTLKVASSLHVTPRSREDIDEDAYIAYLESKLGLRKGSKGKAKSLGDGLDDLFDFANSLGDTLTPPKKAVGGRDDDDDGEDEEDGEDSESEGSEDGEPSLIDADEDATDPGGSDYEDWDGISSQEDESEGDEPVTTASTSNGKYVPPHLRKAQSQNEAPSETQLKLAKQLKGLLNRVSEQNMATIVDSIEQSYRDHKRNDVTSTLTDLIIRGIADHSSLLDSYVVLYATLVSALHKIIGLEFAAYFVQSAVSSYDKHYASSSLPPSQPKSSVEESNPPTQDVGKECQNLIVLISELYNFQVISCILVYDIIRSLLSKEITELNVELLLKIVRSSGHQLRQDDPSALKDIVDIVNSKLSGQGDNLSSRAQFMVETLTNLKNNKLKRNTTQNQGGDAVERMKKFLSGLAKKRHVVAHEPLRVSLADLYSAETKGKWWLVGAAWRGDPLVERQSEVKQVKAEPTSENVLLKLARKQGMNTDIRRSIFVVLMSSDDYADACERLSQLSLTEVQQREIIRVLLHCCGNEKLYNPYYTLVGQQLCRLSHSHKITIQFSLWDFLRALGETTVGGAEVVKNAQDDFGDSDGKKVSTTKMKNLAKAYGWWIAKDCVTLSILKPVDFTLLKPPAQAFLKELFTQIFACSQTSTPILIDIIKSLSTSRNRGSLEEIFLKGSRNEALAMGIVYFLSQAFKKQQEDDTDPEIAKMIQWAVGVARETLRAGVDVVLDMNV